MGIFDSMYNIGGIQTQANLGRWFSNSTENDRVWNLGLIAIGEVTKVHPKSYTADVTLKGSGNRLVGAKESEGKYSCRISTSFAGFSEKYEAPYGDIVPIQEGDLVYIGFFNNCEATPVILGRLHNIGEKVGSPNYHNILPESYLANAKAITEYLHITPIQDYRKIDEKGNFEISSHTKSFIIGKEGNLNDETFDYENLTVKYPTDKSGIGAVPGSYETPELESGTSVAKKTIHVKESQSKPKKYLAVFRDKFEDTVTNWLRIFIDAGKSIFRIIQSRRNNSGLSVSSGTGTATVIEIDKNGAFRIRRNLDTYKYKDGKPTMVESQHYSDVCVNKDGSIIVTSVNKNGTANDFGETPKTVMKIDGSTGKITVSTTNKLNISASQGINMTSKDNIKIISDKKVSIKSKDGIILGSEANVAVMATKSFISQANSIGLQGEKGVTTSASDGAVQITATKSVMMTSDGNAVVSANKKVEVSSIGKTNITSSNVNVKGAVDVKGSFHSLGEQRLTGSTEIVGRANTNSRPPVLEGDVDTEHDYTFAIFCNILISIAISFAINQAISLVMKNMPKLTALVTTMAKAFAYYKIGASIVKSAESINKMMEYKGDATDINAVAKGEVIDTDSPFHDKLNNFVDAKNEESERLAQLEYAEAYEELEKSLMEGIEAVEELIELNATDDEDYGDGGSEEDIKLPPAENFATVNSKLYTEDDDKLPAILQSTKESADSVVTQMKFITAPESEGGLGLDLDGAIQSGNTEMEGVLNCLNLYWNGFSQKNDLKKTFEFVCSKDYIKYCTIITEITGVDSHNGSFTETTKTTVQRYDEDGHDTFVFDSKYNNLTLEDIPLSEDEKTVIMEVLSTLNTTFNTNTFESIKDKVGSGYIDQLSNIVDMSNFRQEGDMSNSREEGAADNETNSTQYSIEKVLNQLNGYIYNDTPQMLPAINREYKTWMTGGGVIHTDYGEYTDTEEIVLFKGWKLAARLLEQEIDNRLGTNSHIYAHRTQTITEVQSSNSSYDHSSYTTIKVIDISSLPAGEQKDCYIDLAVKRYLWENGAQALEHINFAWKVEKCEKANLTDPDDENNYSVDYNHTVTQESSDKKIESMNKVWDTDTGVTSSNTDSDTSVTNG